MEKKLIEVMSGLQCITAILYFSYNYNHFGFSDRTIITVRPQDSLKETIMNWLKIWQN